LISRAQKLLFVFAVLAASPAHAWQIEILDRARGVVSVEYGNGVLLRTADGLWRLDIENAKARLTQIRVELSRAKEGDALPDGKAVRLPASGGIVYLASPTRRYAHGVLGDAVEADALVFLGDDGTKQTVPAGEDAVFEDLVPRLHDFDRDGDPEIVVVKSYLARGSALAVIGRDKKGALRILAETPPIGIPNRWLNPAGFGDFTGAGKQEIALVRMPHALGRLEIWRWENGMLHQIASADGTSNHAIGSRSLNLTVVADFDGDGVRDIAIPSFDRRSIRILRFPGGVSEIARIPLPARSERGMALINSGSSKIMVVGLEDGSVALLRK
jgi:hypothetical protein